MCAIVNTQVYSVIARILGNGRQSINTLIGIYIPYIRIAIMEHYGMDDHTTHTMFWPWHTEMQYLNTKTGYPLVI